jgi:acetolactate synthase-1/3 small subunit
MKKKHILSILVNNRPGVLYRIAGLFSRRGYNIDALSVCATEDPHYSRMSVTLTAEDSKLKQIISQLEKQEDVAGASDFQSADIAFRELLLIKLGVNGEARGQIVDLCTLYKAKAVDIGRESMILELTGATPKIDNFIETLSSYNIIEIARTGGAALERGSKSLISSIKADV